jgi:hypothetical protein
MRWRPLPSPAADVANDEPYWAAVRGLYATSQEPANLENGYGPSA